MAESRNCRLDGNFWRPARSSAGRRGFSVIELLVVLVIITLLLAVTLAVLGRSRQSANSVQCLSNLRQIGLAFQLYAEDNKTRLPEPLLLGTTWEAMITKYVPQRMVFRCPSDAEMFPVLQSSYDWRDLGDPAASLAGRSISSCRSDAILAFEALPGWHTRRMMNIVRLDGSAVSIDEKQALAEILRPATKGESR